MSKFCIGNTRNARSRWVASKGSSNSCTSVVIRSGSEGRVILPKLIQQSHDTIHAALSNHCIKIDFDAYDFNTKIVFRSDDDVKNSRVAAYEYLVP
jgi:hypothetical protein